MIYFKTFEDFHASVTKQMPDAVRFPEQYDICYKLMRMTWDAAKAEQLKAVPDFRDEGWEDRSAIQGTNPGLAELIEANREIERLRKYAVQQHDYFTGKNVPDLIVTTGTDYEEINHEDDHSR
jgi:hypothetical protein